MKICNICLLISILLAYSCNEKSNENIKNNSVDYISQNIENLNNVKKLIPKEKLVGEAGNIGLWTKDNSQLPVFNYTAQLPSKTFLPDGTPIAYPADPFFLIGNYRFNCFVHAGGGYQIMTMERAIARLNSTGAVDSSFTISEINVDGKAYSLTGLDSKIATDNNTKKSFGIGYAEFDYSLKQENINIKRTISTIPSKEINKGCSAMLLSVEIENTSEKDQKISYTEGLNACYEMAIWNNPPFRNKRAEYTVKATADKINNRIIAEFIPKGETELVFGRSRSDHALADGFPPKLFIQMISNENMSNEIESNQINKTKAEISGSYEGSILAKSSVKLNYVIGYLQDDGAYTINDLVKKLKKGIDNSGAPFRDEWRAVIPEFVNEKDELIKQEMQWDIGVLESMANYSEFYDETYIPQGNVYEYGVGVSAAICDMMVLSLPVNYFNPDLAKSITRYTLKHANFRGLIYASDEGAGRMPLGAASKSNSYTYQLMALAEYFKVTKDASLLSEEIAFFGKEYAQKGTVLDRIERIFLFTRDELATGPHGLPRLLNSDWNDCFYFLFKEEGYHHIFGLAESHMNAAMLVLYLGELSDAFEGLDISNLSAQQQDQLKNLILAMQDYRAEMMDVMLEDMGDREFLQRAYIGNRKIGDENIFLEPQIMAVGIEDLPEGKRETIWNSVKTKLWEMEKQGARQNEKGVQTDFEDATAGSRENGGFWYSLNGPLMVNLISLDRDAAKQCFNKMTLSSHAKNYPNYWVGMWSGPDSFDSSMLPTEGVTNKYLFPFPVYCAHPHAWPLWGYYRLKI